MAGRKKKEVEPAKEMEQQNPQPMDLDVRIYSINSSESTKATASVTVNGVIGIRGVRIVEGSKGLFVSMPSYKTKDGYKDICLPVTTEARKQFDDAVMQAYEQTLAQGQDSVQKHHALQQDEAPAGQSIEMAGM